MSDADLPEVTPNPPAHSDADFQDRLAANILDPAGKVRLALEKVQFAIDLIEAVAERPDPTDVSSALVNLELALSLPCLRRAARLLEEKARPEEGK